AFVSAHDAGLGIAQEGKLANLDFAPGLLSFGLRHADASNLRIAIGGVGNGVAVDGFDSLASNFSDGNDALHESSVRELRKSGYDIARGVDAGLGRLHPFIHRDEVPVGL